MSRIVEAQLVEKAARGDAAAFSEIYFRLRDAVYGFSFRMLNDGSLAEDITQEVFMFLIENPAKYNPERGSLPSFLCGVARNRILHHLRKRGGAEITTDFSENPVEPEEARNKNPLDFLLNQELAGKVQENILRLPANQREVVVLRELNEFSYQEIAEITRTDVNTIKVRLHRARKTLAQNIAPYLMKSKENVR